MENEKQVPGKILPLIVICQFLCTSLWFAGNGVVNDLVSTFHLTGSAVGHITSAVQFGFIAGTLVFAFLTLADRYSPRYVFFVSAVFGALLNLGITLQAGGYTSILLFRFGTGFFLAGIYPVGMKIAADYYSKGLGRSLGLLVGALVLGTALPHLLKNVSEGFPWRYVIYSTSILAILGGTVLMVFVPDGPNRKASQKLDFSAMFKVFRSPPFRSAAFGYFGHMWELYAFWAFLPLMIELHNQNTDQTLDVSLWSFLIIGSGGIACFIGGWLAESLGVKRVAATALLISGICCLVSPLLLDLSISLIVILFLFLWGTTVIADSPLFSTLVAHNAEAETKGTALTIVNSIGFGITIVSIQFVTSLQSTMDPSFLFVILGIGPALGLAGLLWRSSNTQ